MDHEKIKTIIQDTTRNKCFLEKVFFLIVKFPYYLRGSQLQMHYEEAELSLNTSWANMVYQNLSENSRSLRNDHALHILFPVRLLARNVGFFSSKSQIDKEKLNSSNSLSVW